MSQRSKNRSAIKSNESLLEFLLENLEWAKEDGDFSLSHSIWTEATKVKDRLNRMKADRLSLKIDRILEEQTL